MATVEESKVWWREMGNDVSVIDQSESVRIGGLVPVDECLISYSRLPVGVSVIHSANRGFQIGCAQNCKCSTEAMTCNDQLGSSILGLQSLNCVLYGWSYQIVATQESGMDRATCAIRIWTPCSSNVQDPVLNIATSPKNDYDCIQSMGKCRVSLDSSDRVWKNFDIRKGIMLAIGAVPGFDRGSALIGCTWKISKLESDGSTVEWLNW